ncbi:MAG: CBS domain-containing protein [Pseudomonadota bacterium]|uniref:CBS domain-containing protein n=1 Tax=Roseovarius TaxID=74030 RepID=UPI0022A857F4|nr:CBS domain-containing protein [Roseovarius sp. EGI FJ00037]MCZ0813081.1 CBS domain-containing protein [Roseovarius sp. EGI FJ00037]
MLVRKVMSSPVISATPETTIRDAAERMRENDVGALPVLQDGKPIGIVTDRDIVIRALAAPGIALSLDTSVADIMARNVITCIIDQDAAEAAAMMGEARIRRVLVVDRSGAAVGILSVGDIAEHVSEELAGQALGEISEARARDFAQLIRGVTRPR